MPRKTVFISIAIIGILGSGFVSWSCLRIGDSATIETVTIGLQTYETSSLLFIADERGFFPDNGLNVVFKQYDSGVTAADALLRNDVDLATCAEFVMVGKVFKKADIRTIVVFDKFQNTYIIGRKDKGISDIADLKGKRIGVTRQSSDEFYLGQFLEINGLSIQQVTLVDITRAQSVNDLVNGVVDAVAIIQPHVNTVKQEFGDSIVVWSAQSKQLDYFNIISSSTWVKSHPKAIVRLLRSLVQSENYLISHLDEAKATIRKHLQYDETYINTVWPEHNFTVSLDQSLILAMEDEARWMIRNNLTAERTVPNFLDYIYADGLKSVNPDAVRIAGK